MSCTRVLAATALVVASVLAQLQPAAADTNYEATSTVKVCGCHVGISTDMQSHPAAMPALAMNHTPALPELQLHCLTNGTLTSHHALRLCLSHATPYSGFMIVLGVLSMAMRHRILFQKA